MLPIKLRAATSHDVKWMEFKWSQMAQWWRMLTHGAKRHKACCCVWLSRPQPPTRYLPSGTYLYMRTVPGMPEGEFARTSTSGSTPYKNNNLTRLFSLQRCLGMRYIIIIVGPDYTIIHCNTLLQYTALLIYYATLHDTYPQCRTSQAVVPRAAHLPIAACQRVGQGAVVFVRARLLAHAFVAAPAALGRIPEPVALVPDCTCTGVTGTGMMMSERYNPKTHCMAHCVAFV